MNIALKILALPIASLVLLGVIMVFRSEVYFPRYRPVEWSYKTHDQIENSNELLDRFRTALRFKTITFGPNEYEQHELKGFGDFIKKSKCFV